MSLPKPTSLSSKNIKARNYWTYSVLFGLMLCSSYIAYLSYLVYLRQNVKQIKAAESFLKVTPESLIDSFSRCINNDIYNVIVPNRAGDLPTKISGKFNRVNNASGNTLYAKEYVMENVHKKRFFHERGTTGNPQVPEETNNNTFYRIVVSPSLRKDKYHLTYNYSNSNSPILGRLSLLFFAEMKKNNIWIPLQCQYNFVTREKNHYFGLVDLRKTEQKKSDRLKLKPELKEEILSGIPENITCILPLSKNKNEKTQAPFAFTKQQEEALLKSIKSRVFLDDTLRKKHIKMKTKP